MAEHDRTQLGGENDDHADEHVSGAPDAITGTLDVDVTGDADTVDNKHASELGGTTANGYGSKSRSTGTTYQNTTGNPIHVIVWGDPTSTGTDAALRLKVGSTSTPSLRERHGVGGDSDLNDFFSVSAIVPDGHYYEVTATTAETHGWHEQQLS